MNYVMNLSQYSRASGRILSVVSAIARNNGIGDVVMKNRLRMIMLDEQMVLDLEETRKDKGAVMTLDQLRGQK